MVSELIGHGVYTFTEAAGLTRLKRRRIHDWFQPRKHAGRRGPVFSSDYSNKASSFHDLIEVLVAGNLRERGVSLIAIRKVHSILSAQLKTSHPFCHSKLLTDGEAVFVAVATE